MKKVSIIFFILLFSLVFLGKTSAYDVPYKMGKGRYLDSKEKKELYFKIRNETSKGFKDIYFKKLGERIHLLTTFLNRSTSNIEILEMPKGENTIVYLVLLNPSEGIPKDELEKRKARKNKYYDIWVISCDFVKFEYNKKYKTFTFIKSGAAE